MIQSTSLYKDFSHPIWRLDTIVLSEIGFMLRSLPMKVLHTILAFCTRAVSSPVVSHPRCCD